MNNTISVYELLGLIKDGKAPKKIKYENNVYEFTDYDYRCIVTEIEKGFVEYWLIGNYNQDLRHLLNEKVEILEENKQLKEQLKQKEDIIYKIKKCIEENEEYYGDYMGDGNYTMYSMMGANNNRIPYIKSNLIKQILDNKGDENDG